MATGHTLQETWDEEYEQVVVYLHKKTGYYFDPRANQYLVPYSSDGAAYAYQLSSPQAEQHSATAPNRESTSENSLTQPQGSTRDLSEAEELEKLVKLEKEFVDSQKPSENVPSITSVLAAVSDQVMERCGYEFKEESGMYYQGFTGLFYDQDSRLYFDPDRGCYYDYDPVERKYTFHSRVKLANKNKEKEEENERKKRLKEDIIDLCHSSSEDNDSPEEGEIISPKRPRLPKGSPPPESEWAPCVRLLVTDSECLERGSQHVVTIDGAHIGREPPNHNGIKIPELLVSKLHALISYDVHSQQFTAQDLGSVNGTFLNKDQRLSEPKEVSAAHPIEHGDALTLGSTTLSLHIHTGWETCDWCDPVRLEEWRKGIRKGGSGQEETVTLNEESLELKRRKELNRIKKRHGLRLKDVFREESAATGDKYQDRAATRRKVVGSDMPELTYPDSAPSSVDRPISSSNLGHNLLLRMGWKEGAGLGRTEQGRTAPVQAQIHDSKAGLGSAYSYRNMDTVGSKASASSRSQHMKKRFGEVVSRSNSKKS